MAIAFLILSVYKMYQISEKLTNKKVISIIISTLIILNPFTFELMIYLEKGVSIMSFCASIYAVYYMLKYFEDKRKSSLIKTILLLLISSFSYQGTTTIFVCICLVLIIKYSNTIKDFFKNNVIVAFCFGIPYLLNYICIKLFYTSTRIEGEKSILANISQIISDLPTMLIDTYNILPKYLFLIIFVVLLIIYLISLCTNKNVKHNIYILFGFCYVIIGTFLITVLPQFVLETSSVELVARSTISFGAIIGITMFYAFSNIKINLKLKFLIEIIAVVYLVIEVFYIQNLIADHYVLNYLDLQTATLIEQEIEKYETENNITIEYIVYYEDANISNSYPNLINCEQINRKVVSMYEKLHLLEYVSGRSYTESVETNSVYAEYFSQYDWDFFDTDQIIFDGNVAHICQF